MSTHREQRELILKTVNKWRLNKHGTYIPLTMRHIQRAVCIARRQKLINDHHLYELAGFNAPA